VIVAFSGAQGFGDSIIDRLAAKLDEMAVEQKRVSFAVAEKIEEVVVEQKRASFAVKSMTDAFPPNIGLIVPSEDCKTDKSGKYRALMLALRLNEANDVSSLATAVEHVEWHAEEFSFDWADKEESASYVDFQTYLKAHFEVDCC
jgi:hypothetical protein